MRPFSGIPSASYWGVRGLCCMSSRFQEPTVTRASSANHNDVCVPRAYGHESIHARTKIVALCLMKKGSCFVRFRVLPTLEFTGRGSDSCTFGRVRARKQGPWAEP